MRNRKIVRPSGVVSEMVKEAGEAGVGMITDLVNLIIVVEVIPAEWEFSTITLYKLRKLLHDINCFKGKRKRQLKGTEINRSDSEDS